MQRPKPGDYASYYQTYIDEVIGDDGLKILLEQYESTKEFYSSLSEKEGIISYAEGNWTVKEVIGLITARERVMAYRALCIARGEKQPLPGFEQNDYVIEANFNKRIITDLVEEFCKVRESTIALFNGLEEEKLNHRGTASGKEVTVRALLFIILGHCAHHIKILKTKYLI